VYKISSKCKIFSNWFRWQNDKIMVERWWESTASICWSTINHLYFSF